MRTSKPAKWMIWLALGAYLFFGAWQMPGLVLCIEQNGQVALEAAIQGYCGDRETTASRTGLPREGAVSPCQSCTDLPVSIGAQEASIQGITGLQDLPQEVASVDAIIPVLSSLPWRTLAVMPQPPPDKPPHHQILSSVILLI